MNVNCNSLKGLTWQEINNRMFNQILCHEIIFKIKYPSKFIGPVEQNGGIWQRDIEMQWP